MFALLENSSGNLIKSYSLYKEQDYAKELLSQAIEGNPEVALETIEFIKEDLDAITLDLVMATYIQKKFNKAFIVLDKQDDFIKAYSAILKSNLLI